MTFYLKPPRNTAFLNTIRSCVLARVNYFTFYLTGKTYGFIAGVRDFEYLICDSPFDRIGHFMLRLLCQTTELILFKTIFIQKEIELFNRRLSFISSPRELKKFIDATVRHCDEAIQNFDSQLQALPHSLVNVNVWKEFILTLKNINRQLELIMYHLFENSLELPSDHVCDTYFKVPFKMSLNRVSNRQVIIRNGYAISPCSKWKEVLSELFEYHLYISAKQAEKMKCHNLLQNDARFSDIVKDAISLFNDNNNSNIQFDRLLKTNIIINKSNINDVAVFFPPCMYNLQLKLKENHRLAHNNRYQLTTFLKNIGMSYEDALVFWSHEYSKVNSKNSKCKCTWQTNSKKLRYSIRHIYGLEGRRVNYKPHSCNYLQRLGLGALDEGGCPFKYFSDENLFKSVDKRFQKYLFNSDRNEILKTRVTEPSLACHLLHSSIVNASAPDNKNYVHKQENGSKLHSL